ncbi:MAG: efflux RND transporter permease subunit [Acidobacteriota bacterium]|nr:efflux RND transporter permease subunit [Acidobacteriota bacterium]
MSLPSLAVRRPVMANLVMLLIIVGGVVSYQNMGSEIFPEIPIGMVTVTTVLPGASPKEIEQLLTIPLEEQLQKVDEIDQLTSMSAENISNIMIMFEPGVENIFEKVTEIQNQIEKVERFPGKAEPPDVREMSMPLELLTLALVGTAPEGESRDFARDLSEELKTVPGVSEIDIGGLREREIWVEVDPHRLQSYGLSLQQVSRALGNRNLNLPGGLIRLDRGEYSIRTEAEFRDLQEILSTIVLQDPDGGFIYVRDLATVRDTFAERMTLARLDGHPSINLNIKKDPAYDAADVAAEIRRRVDGARDRLPAGADLQVVNDSSIEIDKRLRALFQNFGVGLGLVAVSFTLAIGWRAATIISAGIPVAFLGSFIFLNAYGYTMNQLVITAMIIVLGLIVDDAIVICENIYRHLEEGMPLRRAAVFGAEQLMAPVIATVMTTVAAFLPLLLMTGMMGKVMGVIPVVICLALLASLLEAFFILPAHAFEWTGKAASHTPPEPRAWVQTATRLYAGLLRRCLRFRYGVVALLLVTAFGAILLGTRMDFVLFGGTDIRSFSVAMEGRASSSFLETDRILTELEKIMLGLQNEAAEDVDTVRTRGGMLQRGFESVSGTHVGQVSVNLADLTDRTRSGNEVLEDARSRIGEVVGPRVLNFEKEMHGPPVGKAINVRVKGDNFETLRVITDEVKSYLETVEGVTDVADNFPPGKEEVRPVLDLQRISDVGLDVGQVAAEIRAGFDGIEATRVYDGNEEIEVIVKYDADSRASVAQLAEMRFATADGLIPFSNIGTLVREPGYSQIQHHDTKRSITVSGGVQEGVITSQRANTLLMNRFTDLSQRYPGYTLEYGGEWEDTQESIASLMRAFLIAIIVIYVILGGLFQSFMQPLVVMFSVPFAFIGVVVGFVILDEPLGMAAMIGTIALTGIVVNDSLIFIDFINRRRGEGHSADESILRAGAARLRPILLTSVTTVAGLLPMSLGLFGIDESMKPMAVAIAWGLSFATILTLIVIPCAYRIADDLSLRVRGLPLSVTRETDHADGTLATASHH